MQSPHDRASVGGWLVFRFEIMENKMKTANTGCLSKTLVEVLAKEYAYADIEEVMKALRCHYGNDVWTDDELCAEFGISHFDPPYVHVIRRSDGKRGSVAYINTPRIYFWFVSDSFVLPWVTLPLPL